MIGHPARQLGRDRFGERRHRGFGRDVRAGADRPGSDRRHRRRRASRCGRSRRASHARHNRRNDVGRATDVDLDRRRPSARDRPTPRRRPARAPRRWRRPHRRHRSVRRRWPRVDPPPPHRPRRTSRPSPSAPNSCAMVPAIWRSSCTSPRAEHKPCARFGEPRRQLRPDAAAGAGHQAHAPGQARRRGQRAAVPDAVDALPLCRSRRQRRMADEQVPDEGLQTLGLWRHERRIAPTAARRTPWPAWPAPRRRARRRPTIDAPTSLASSMALTRFMLTGGSAEPPPTEKTNRQSFPLSRDDINQFEYAVSHPSSLTRAVSSETLSVTQ